MVLKTGVQSQVESYESLKKMVLNDSMTHIQHYKVSEVIQGKE